MYLNVKTEADTLKSTIRTEQLIKHLKNNGVNSCAVANTNFHKLIDYKNSFIKNGLKPVVALRAKVLFGPNSMLPVLLYAQDTKGYNNLLKASSGIMQNKDGYMPLKWLDSYGQGVLAVLPMNEGNWIASPKEVSMMKDIFKGSLFCGISRTGKGKYENEEKAVSMANQLAIPIAALHESFYLTKEDAFSYEVVRAIDSGSPLERLEALDDSQYLPSAQEMSAWFADKPQWLLEADNILNACNVDFGEYEAHMPEYPLTNGETPQQCLARLAYEGLKVRMNGQITTEYSKRLDYELGIISKMGYDSYFLIVADYMAFAKREGILTGPGRGSSASSLVAYSLWITQVDPIQYQLLFERFLNPYRVSLPDIDIDFIDSRRHEVIQYVKDKYGKDYVAQILTVGTLAMKGVGRDVARMLQFNDGELKSISSMLDKSKQSNIQAAYEKSKDLQTFVAVSGRNQIWYDTCCRLEGVSRNTSTHAAGVVFTPKPLINYVPVEAGNAGIYLTQWTMNEVESVGVLKMDFLGLRNLGLIEDILQSLENTYNVKPTLETIPFNDANTFNLLQQGLTEGIFQLESDGMRKALMEIKPTTIEDIIAINALYRPGPMEFISSYARRKHGQEAVTYLHPLLEPILKETYGIIIYQEQILRIAQQFAGFTLGEADLLRRAIGKKKREILEEQQVLFVKGAISEGHDEKIAIEIYSLIVKFAEYGFPKSHSTAYSFITYYMAFLKANYPSHFYTAQLNGTFGNDVKAKRILAEVKKRGVRILPMDIRYSKILSTSENKAIRLGFKHLKGIAEPKLIAHTRYNAGTTDLFEFAKAVGSKFDIPVMTALIKAGAFDDVFPESRNTLIASLERAMDHSAVGDTLDFGFGTPTYEISSIQDNKYKMEVEAYGFATTQHPIEQLRPATLQGTITTVEVGKTSQLIGIIEEVKVTETKKQEKMAIVTISDENGQISITVFPMLYGHVHHLLKEGNMIFAEGKAEEKYGKKSINANKIVLFQ